MTVKRVLIAWLLSLAAGSSLMALPDTGPRLIRLSRTHGPGPVDLVGIGLVAVGVAVLWWWLIRRRRAIVARLGGAGMLAAALVLVLSFAEVAWSVLSDKGSWWLIGAAVATAVQLMALASSGRRREDASEKLER